MSDKHWEIAGPMVAFAFGVWWIGATLIQIKDGDASKWAFLPLGITWWWIGEYTIVRTVWKWRQQESKTDEQA